MKALITGASGIIGSYLVKTAPKIFEVFPCCFENRINQKMVRMDITDLDMVRYIVLDIKPDVVIHCASESRTDWVEENKLEGWHVNISGLNNLLIACKAVKSHFVYVSSNNVYDGMAPPYSECSDQNAVNEYGRTKILAEELVKTYPFISLIVRPILQHGNLRTSRRNTFVSRAIETLKAGKELKVAQDMISQPTYALDCAEAIWKLIYYQKKQHDSFNIAPVDAINLYDFAVDIAKVYELEPRLIEPVAFASFSSLSKRPLNTTYDVSKLYSVGITIPGHMDSLKRMKEEANA